MLFVNDEPKFKDCVTYYGRQFGYSLETVENATQAIEAISDSARHIDIVFSDHVMSEMDGIELLSWTRSQGLWVPFIVASEEWPADSILQLKKLGNVRAINKPFRADQFGVALSELELSQFLTCHNEHHATDSTRLSLRR
jgi:DNA-binding NtrC family response regulator